MPQLIQLDVSELEPPEPLSVILSELHRIDDDVAMKVIHRRHPIPLYGLLKEKGYAYFFLEIDTSNIEIYIWREGDTHLGEFCGQAAVREVEL